MKKKLFIILGIAVIISLFYTSCDEIFDKFKNEKLEKETISGKWNVINSSTYESFEFNESGNYIVVKNSYTKSIAAQDVFYGEYEINGETIELLDFGKLEDVEIDDDELDATVVESGNEEPIMATKAAEFENTSRTDLLCRTWSIAVPAYETDATEILFSKAGTYLVTYSDGETGLSSWQWKDNDEIILCYSWYMDPTCDGDNEVEIVELTQNSCKMNEDGDIWVLRPAISGKSGIIKPEKQDVKNPNSFTGR